MKPELLTTELYVADTGNSRVRKIVHETCDSLPDSAGEPQVCGNHGKCGFDGWCICAEYKSPDCSKRCPGKWVYEKQEALKPLKAEATLM